MAVYDITTQTIDVESLESGDILNCPYTGSSKSIQLPKGIYKLEVWGSKSQKYSDGEPGKGGYSTGELTLEDELTSLYLYVGGYGSSEKSAGFNGGSATNNYGAGGGGGTDIRISADSLYARVIVAGGGGGNGYSSASPGGHGGGLNGIAGTSGSVAGGGGGTQTSGGTCYNVSGAGKFGEGGYYSTSGGGAGGGWYGGGHGYSSGTDSAGGGGSGYIYTEEYASNYPSGCLLNSSYYLNNASTLNGSSTFLSPAGISETGHSDYGYARITIIEIIVGTNEITYSTPYASQSPKMCGDVLKSVHLPILTDDTHLFLAWYYEPTFETEAKVDDPVTGNLTLYAKWKDKTFVTITHHLIGCIADTVIERIYEGENYNNSFLKLDNKWTIENSACYIEENGIEYTDFTYENGILDIPSVLNNLDIYVTAVRVLNLETIGLYEIGNNYKLTIKTDNDLIGKLNYTADEVNIILDKFDLSNYANTLEKFEVQYE